MTESSLNSYSAAVADFHNARRKAALKKLLDRIGRASNELLPYEEVVRRLAGRESGRVELREIPLDSIVGSVGRYRDFTRDFLPLKDSDESRWAHVKVAMTGLAGVPPIEAYQVGEAYFVRDGNHRVSVARELGATDIQAYVREVQTKVPLSPEVDLDELIIKTEMAEFLKRTQLDVSRPDTDFTVTAPGKYTYLEHEIESSAKRPEAPLSQKAQRWHDRNYLPVRQLIRELGMLREFAGRTETDLYEWIMQYRSELEQALGWSISPRSVAADLIARSGDRVRSRLSGRLSKIGEQQLPAVPDPNGKPGWLSEILVPISGEADDWVALHQADLIAVREGARVLGLHVARSEEEADNERARFVQGTFDAECASNEAQCRLAIEVGKIARTICERARWVDLVVVKLNHPPDPRPVAKLSSGFRALLRGSPRPVMAVPRAESQLNHALLAYDGSPKATEALYLAAYMAGYWEIGLTVVSVSEGGRPAERMLESAIRYLEERAIPHSTVAAEGQVADEILQAAEEHEADFVICGGYGRKPVAEVVLGSAVDGLLRATSIPILICH